MRALTKNDEPIFDLMCLRSEQEDFISGKAKTQAFYDYKNGGVKLDEENVKNLDHF